jgi:hypothetical protein
MALHKESYGLIYNDDGSLCVTLRKDDVPFEGVTSFAVEEGTTNLHPNPEDLNAFNGYPSKWSYKGETYNGMKVFEWTVKDGTRQYIGIDQSSIGNWVGKTVTFSVYYYVQNVPSWGIYIASDATIHKSIVIDLGDGWKRRIITATLNATTCDFWLNPFSSTAGVFKFCGFQIEEKPFATSFVDGMRADGQLRIENVLRNRDSWVVSFWYKHPGDFSVARMLFGSPENDIVDPNEFSVFVTSTGTIKILNRVNNTTIFSIESSASIPANEWIFLTFIYTGSEIRAYMNRNQILSGTATINWNFTAGDPSKLWIGSVRTGNLSRTGGLFANLLIARYQPAVWTAEYIQEIYNMRRPFSVQPKMPII